jgi:hypothetical protein
MILLSKFNFRMIASFDFFIWLNFTFNYSQNRSFAEVYLFIYAINLIGYCEHFLEVIIMII